jgi:cytochrome c oxidase subunit I
MAVCPVVDDRITAVVSGVLATAAMLAFMWPVDAFTSYQLLAPRAIAELLNAPVTVGVAAFAAAGTLVWPLVFLVIGQHLAPRDVMQGVVLSLILWIGFIVAFVPTFEPTRFLVFVLLSFLAHVVYGAVLGLSFDRLDGEHGPLGIRPDANGR